MQLSETGKHPTRYLVQFFNLVSFGLGDKTLAALQLDESLLHLSIFFHQPLQFLLGLLFDDIMRHGIINSQAG